MIKIEENLRRRFWAVKAAETCFLWCSHSGHRAPPPGVNWVSTEKLRVETDDFGVCQKLENQTFKTWLRESWSPAGKTLTNFF